MEKRIFISNGFRWYRWPFVVLGSIFLLLIVNRESLIWTIPGLLFCIGLFFLLKNSRRIEFDSNFLYMIRGANERAIPFHSIFLIRKMRTRVNNSRVWKIRYKDEAGDEKTCYTLPRFLISNMDEFCDNVRRKNGAVIIEMPIMGA